MSIIDKFLDLRLPIRFDDGRREEALEDLLETERIEHRETSALLTKLQQEKKVMTSTTNNTSPTAIDVPVDLGQGYIVMIKGLPGRPTKAACERLCKVIMAYAVESVPQTQRADSTEKVPKMPLLAKKTEEISDEDIISVLAK